MKTATATGSVASFWSPKPAAIKSLKVYFKPKQAGEGDPSPDNVRPIEGWTGVDLFYAKSDYKIDVTPGTTLSHNVTWVVDEDGLVKATGTPTSYASCKVGTITVNGDETIYAKIEGTLNNVTFNAPTLYDSTGTRIIATMSDAILLSGLDLSQYNDVKQVAIYTKRKNNGVEMNGGSCAVTVTKDVKPTVNTSLIDFSSVGTMYGGYVDLVTGEIWKTHHHYVFTGDETFYTSGSNWATSFIPLVNGEKMRAYGPSYSVACTHYPYAPYKQGAIGVMYGENTCTFDSRIRDAEGWKAFAKEQYDAGTPIEVAYLLRDPVLVGTLTPQQLSSLVGRNCYYSNADRVEVEYEYADSPELEVIKKRIALNEPHLGDASGSTANFYTDMASPMKSLKVNFEAKQSGTGDPSPDNVRPITGVDQINVCRTGKNLCHIVGYSAQNINTPTAARSLTNNYGTTLSTIDFQLPDSSVVVTQTNHPNTTLYNSYTNGFFTIIEDSMILGKHYNVSFRVTDITNNPLNASLSDIIIYPPYGRGGSPSVDGDRLIYYDFRYGQHPSVPARHGIEVRNCGMSFTLSEFMVTEVTEEDQTFEPYKGSIIPYNLSELGTQYGGYVDLIKGELTATWNKISIKDVTVVKLDDSLTASQNFQIFPSQQAAIGFPTTTCPFICDTFMALPQSGSSISTRVNIVVWQSAVDGTLRVKTQEYCGLTADEFKEQFGDVQFVYQLRNPISYQLTPQQIKTFRGTNNIYSFDGTVDVKYWLHSDVKTERKTAQI